MKKLTATLCLTFAVLIGSAGLSANADFQKRVSAYERAVSEQISLSGVGSVLSVVE